MDPSPGQREASPGSTIRDSAQTTRRAGGSAEGGFTCHHPTDPRQTGARCTDPRQTIARQVINTAAPADNGDSMRSPSGHHMTRTAPRRPGTGIHISETDNNSFDPVFTKPITSGDHLTALYEKSYRGFAPRATRRDQPSDMRSDADLARNRHANRLKLAPEPRQARRFCRPDGTPRRTATTADRAAGSGWLQPGARP